MVETVTFISNLLATRLSARMHTFFKHTIVDKQWRGCSIVMCLVVAEWSWLSADGQDVNWQQGRSSGHVTVRNIWNANIMNFLVS